MSLSNIRKQEEAQEFEYDQIAIPPSDMVAFTEQRSCADIYRMFRNDQLEIKPDFQREIVWPRTSQTRFIDSLSKQLPIPSMCFSLDYKTEKRWVVDGLQRISSIISFLNEPKNRFSRIDDIDPKIAGKTPEEIKKEHPEVYSRVENLMIPITVIRCDMTKKDHREYLFTIFHRLNAGGNKLNNQEIRNCIYSGSLNNFLKEIVKDKNFRSLLGLAKDRHYRYAYEELVLRIIAFYEEYEKYTGRLSSFLNIFMDTKRNGPIDWINQTSTKLKNTILFLSNVYSDGGMRGMSKAQIDAIFVGLLRSGFNKSPSVVRRKLDALQVLQIETLQANLSDKTKVIERMKAVVEALNAC